MPEGPPLSGSPPRARRVLGRPPFSLALIGLVTLLTAVTGATLGALAWREKLTGSRALVDGAMAQAARMTADHAAAFVRHAESTVRLGPSLVGRRPPGPGRLPGAGRVRARRAEGESPAGLGQLRRPPGPLRRRLDRRRGPVLPEPELPPGRPDPARGGPHPARRSPGARAGVGRPPLPSPRAGLLPPGRGASRHRVDRALPLLRRGARGHVRDAAHGRGRRGARGLHGGPLPRRPVPLRGRPPRVAARAGVHRHRRRAARRRAERRRRRRHGDAGGRGAGRRGREGAPREHGDGPLVPARRRALPRPGGGVPDR